ncbi:hypothetical protein C8F01DRAFT_1080888 [Mycena amicta]|nr:hypothetical protein C8F01DRAFT_1080888 [Mycena amicta]
MAIERAYLAAFAQNLESLRIFFTSDVDLGLHTRSTRRTRPRFFSHAHQNQTNFFLASTQDELAFTDKSRRAHSYPNPLATPDGIVQRTPSASNEPFRAGFRRPHATFVVLSRPHLPPFPFDHDEPAGLQSLPRSEGPSNLKLIKSLAKLSASNQRGEGNTASASKAGPPSPSPQQPSHFLNIEHLQSSIHTINLFDASLSRLRKVRKSQDEHLCQAPTSRSRATHQSTAEAFKFGALFAPWLPDCARPHRTDTNDEGKDEGRRPTSALGLSRWFNLKHSSSNALTKTDSTNLNETSPSPSVRLHRATPEHKPMPTCMTVAARENDAMCVLMSPPSTSTKFQHNRKPPKTYAELQLPS